MADKKKKGLNVNIGADEVMYSSMSKSKEGYSHAGISAKRGEGEYISISYEWKGDMIPDFAMDLMGFMQANKTEIAVAVAKHAEEYAAKKGKMSDDEEDMMDPKDKKGKKKKKMDDEEDMKGGNKNKKK